MEDTSLDAERQLTLMWAASTPLEQMQRLAAAWEFARQLRGATAVMNPTEVTCLVLEQLSLLKIPYIIGGSVASSLYGEVRFTQDTDVLAALTRAAGAALVAALQDEFYVSPEAVQEAVRRKSSFNLIHFTTQHKVDVFISLQRDFDRSRLSRSLAPPGFPSIFLISSPEDTILAKLEWYKSGGQVSQRQWRDILGVMASQHGRLDQVYLENWAQKLMVLDLLERAQCEIRPLIE